MTARPPRKGKIYTIAGSDSFAASLAAGIKAQYGDVGNPLALARVTLLVPTRRAVLAVRKAFTDLEPSGVTLMPQILPLGDVGDDDLVGGEDAAPGFEDLRDGLAPVIAPLKRQLLLTQLIAARSDVAGLQSSRPQRHWLPTSSGFSMRSKPKRRTFPGLKTWCRKTSQTTGRQRSIS